MHHFYAKIIGNRTNNFDSDLGCDWYIGEIIYLPFQCEGFFFLLGFVSLQILDSVICISYKVKSP